MAKGLFAGLAGLGAAIAFFQVQGDGGTDTSASMPAPDAAAAPLQSESVGAHPATAAPPSDGGSVARAPAPDAALRAPVSADGGPVYVGDPPGRLRAEPDSGASDAGSTGAAQQASAAAQADEVRRLRERVAMLEQQLARSNSDAQTRQLNELNQQVAALREQLAQEQARRQSEEVAAQKARAGEQEAVTALSAAQQQLATGNSRVFDQLDSAAGSLPAPAQNAVQSAKAALQSGDLAAARYWLSVAIAQTQRKQIKE